MAGCLRVQYLVGMFVRMAQFIWVRKLTRRHGVLMSIGADQKHLFPEPFSLTMRPISLVTSHRRPSPGSDLLKHLLNILLECSRETFLIYTERG